MVGEDDAVEKINPAAESVLNTSARQMEGRAVADCIFIDEEAREGLRRAREGSLAVSMNDVRIRAGDHAPISASVQIAHIQALPGKMLVCMQSQEMAKRMNPGKRMNSAANSAVGMAAMLTHEIKNPLAGISGAAQLLSMSLDREKREMTDLIFAETPANSVASGKCRAVWRLRPAERRGHEYSRYSGKSAKTCPHGICGGGIDPLRI